MRHLAQIPGSYILAIFDCCREKLRYDAPPPTATGIKGVVHAARGTGEAPEEDTDEHTSFRNLIMVFGCPPNSFVPADSTLTVELFQNILKQADKDNMAILPGHLQSWTPGGQGEVVCFFKQDLVLKLHPKNFD
jgi:hypothetical protein